MTAPRSTHQERSYIKFSKDKKHKNDQTCDFCKITKGHYQNITETRNLRVIRNKFPYSLWDGQGVIDHLMIIPKRHIGKLADFSDEAKLEYIALLEGYEAKGYNIYTRSPLSTTRSVYHYHTHLLRLDHKDRRLLVLIKKPYFRWIV